MKKLILLSFLLFGAGYALNAQVYVVAASKADYATQKS